MTTTESAADNGVNVQALLEARAALTDAPEAAEFTWRATTEWVRGTHSQSTIHSFHGAMQELTHEQVHVFDADHPTVLVGGDRGVTPVEFVLHALAACLTAGLANIAAARGVMLTEVESTIEGDIDLLGVLGLSDEVRRGFRRIKVGFTVRGDEPEPDRVPAFLCLAADGADGRGYYRTYQEFLWRAGPAARGLAQRNAHRDVRVHLGCAKINLGAA